jgi:hypothetical protein
MPDDALLMRVMAEYLEMPGLRVTLEQASRLFGVERELCYSVCAELVRQKFLWLTADRHYARATDGHHARMVGTAVCHPRPASARLEPGRLVEGDRDAFTSPLPRPLAGRVLRAEMRQPGAGADRTRRFHERGVPMTASEEDPTIAVPTTDDRAFGRAVHDGALMRTVRSNMLIEGSAAAVEQSLAALIPHLELPVCCWTPVALLPSPHEVKSLVIRGVEALSQRQQRDVSGWIERASVAGTRVVATTTVPLFERVAAGTFLDCLYYRLNTVKIDAGNQTFIAGADGRLRPRRKALGADQPDHKAS